MTKKDYQIIANAIAKTLKVIKELKQMYPSEVVAIEQQRIGVYRLQDKLRLALQENNPKFDYQKFSNCIDDYLLENPNKCKHNNKEWRDENGKSYLNCFDCGGVLRIK